jgi:hypothetical protein
VVAQHAGEFRERRVQRLPFHLVHVKFGVRERLLFGDVELPEPAVNAAQRLGKIAGIDDRRAVLSGVEEHEAVARPGEIAKIVLARELRERADDRDYHELGLEIVRERALFAAVAHDALEQRDDRLACQTTAYQRPEFAQVVLHEQQRACIDGFVEQGGKALGERAQPRRNAIVLVKCRVQFAAQTQGAVREKRGRQFVFRAKELEERGVRIPRFVRDVANRRSVSPAFNEQSQRRSEDLHLRRRVAGSCIERRRLWFYHVRKLAFANSSVTDRGQLEALQEPGKHAGERSQPMPAG